MCFAKCGANMQLFFHDFKKHDLFSDCSFFTKIDNNETLSGDYKRGFISNGLWSMSRHPNFISEQLIWVAFYLFSISATGIYLNWSIIGCVLLIILFYNSANYTESISEKKYPDYKNYKQNVSMFIGFKQKNLWDQFGLIIVKYRF